MLCFASPLATNYKRTVFFGGVVMYTKKIRVGGVRISLAEGSNHAAVS